MKKLASISVVLFFLAGCQGTMVDPDTTVTTFNMYTDQLEALLVKECTDMHGVEGCTPYPNEMECDSLKIDVHADGRTFVNCKKAGQVVRMGEAGIGDGVPFICKANDDMSCQTCVDVFGSTVYDNCNRNAQLFRRVGSGWKDAPGGTGWLEEPGPGTKEEPPKEEPPKQQPPGGGADQCAPANAALLYARELNRLLKHEGLGFSWVPDMDKLGDPKTGFFASKGYNYNNMTCKAFASSIKSHIHKCAEVRNGECHYCWGGSKKTCRCYRINLAALKAACSVIPPACDNQMEWSAVLIMSYGISNKWLFSPSYTKFYGQVTPDGVDKVKWPKCKGSPLVLDLLGDGIAPTAPDKGVDFDLLSFGKLRTAWVQGDDALLAMDRDGNGRIDSGAELFGEATEGRPWEDGFDALATLDDNRDGKIDRKDRRFGELLVWRDANGDGVSQASELGDLRGHGITSLGVTKRHVPGAVDRHGNDFTTQSRFTRADGSSNLLADVFFIAGETR